MGSKVARECVRVSLTTTRPTETHPLDGIHPHILYSEEYCIHDFSLHSLVCPISVFAPYSFMFLLFFIALLHQVW